MHLDIGRRDIVILAGVRTAFGTMGGALKGLNAQELAIPTAKAALQRAGVAPDEVLHVGDTFSTDVVGARAAGMRAVLLDPFGHYEGAHLDVPRVESVAAVADSLVRACALA